jgi:methylglutaconyl-CoA hydratase
MNKKRYNTLLTREADGILIITLNRPERHNALTPEMQQELLSELESAGNGTAHVVILTGAGRSFCAGLDLTVLQAMATQNEAEQETDARRIARLFRTLYALPMPTIAAVNGHAIAGGTGLATLCDFTLAVPEAKFGYTEVKIGFVPALVSAFLSLQIGEKKARSLLLTGRIFDVHEAQALGLVNEIVEPDAMLPRATAFALEMLQNSPAALRTTKQLLVAQSLSQLDALIERAIAVNISARQHPDFREGVTAFLEKRKPLWHNRNSQ